MPEPRYRLELREPKGLTVLPWRGKPTPEALAAYVDDWLRSLEPGGSRYHLTRARGYKPVLTSARILTAKTGKVKAEWRGYTVAVYSGS